MNKDITPTPSSERNSSHVGIHIGLGLAATVAGLAAGFGLFGAPAGANYPHSIGTCTGIKSVDVEPGDTYDELVDRHTDIDQALDRRAVIEDIYMEFDTTDGKLSESFKIVPNVNGGPGPAINAGDTVRVPAKCTAE